MSTRILDVATFALGAVSLANGQNFNVDIGAVGTPSAGYGAAANQPGTWNTLNFPFSGGPPVALVDLHGVPTGVVVSETGGFTDGCETGLLAGDDGALLNDNQYSGNPNTSHWNISGLAPGNYDVYAYVLAPCESFHGVTIEFLEGSNAFVASSPGTFTGAWVAGVTHLVVPVQIDAGTVLRFEVGHGFVFGGLAGFQLRRTDSAFAPFCAGDGTLVDHSTPCPCGNIGAAGRGCAHSASSAGASLTAFGGPDTDDVGLDATGMPATAFALFLQHDARADAVFHDGVICAGGALIRLRGRSSAGGAALFPDVSLPIDATITLSQRGAIFPGQGVRRYYATWFRNASSTFCPPATANVTNGWIVDW